VFVVLALDLWAALAGTLELALFTSAVHAVVLKEGSRVIIDTVVFAGAIDSIDTLVTIHDLAGGAETALHTSRSLAVGQRFVSNILTSLFARRSTRLVLHSKWTHNRAHMVISPFNGDTKLVAPGSHIGNSSTETFTITSLVTATSIKDTFSVEIVLFTRQFTTTLSELGSAPQYLTLTLCPSTSGPIIGIAWVKALSMEVYLGTAGISSPGISKVDGITDSVPVHNIIVCPVVPVTTKTMDPLTIF